MSSIRCRAVIPCGSSYGPGRSTFPERQKTRVPVESGGAPICAYSFGAELEDLRHRRDRLDVVDQRRRGVDAGDRRERRLRARLPALALERLEQRRLLAADVRAGAAVDHDLHVLEQPRCAGLPEGAGQRLVLGEVLAADVDVDPLRLDRVRRDQAALEQPVRHAQHDLAVLERPRLRLVRVDRDVDRLRDLVRRRDEARLAARREERAAAAAQVRLDQLLGHRLRRHRPRPLELHVAAGLPIGLEVAQRRLLGAGEDEHRPVSHCAAPRRSPGRPRASRTRGSGGRRPRSSAWRSRRGTRPRAA